MFGNFKSNLFKQSRRKANWSHHNVCSFVWCVEKCIVHKISASIIFCVSAWSLKKTPQSAMSSKHAVVKLPEYLGTCVDSKLACLCTLVLNFCSLRSAWLNMNWCFTKSLGSHVRKINILTEEWKWKEALQWHNSLTRCVGNVISRYKSALDTQTNTWNHFDENRMTVTL